MLKIFDEYDELGSNRQSFSGIRTGIGSKSMFLLRIKLILSKN